jgi:DNA-binding LacI/PurR family transcriptional regulator
MPLEPRVSIKDIARTAGVSFSTVSRALHNSPLISEEVRTRIQELARTMGYTPNALAQSLQARLTHSIGLIITTIADPFFMEVVSGVEQTARQAGFSVFLAMSNNDPEQEIQILETFNRRRVDGVILAASRIGADYASRLERIQIPVIMINNQAEGEYKNLYSVSVDDYAGGCMAMEHLIALGHQKIGYIGVSNRPGSNGRRMKSYFLALQKHGIIAQPEWICLDVSIHNEDMAGDIRVGQTLTPKLIQAGVTAIFCYCDTVAAGALLACRKLGVSVPEELSLIGFDDNILCEIVSPALTTIHQPKVEMGQMAMQMLLNSFRGEDIQDYLLQPALVVRESTAPPAAL